MAAFQYQDTSEQGFFSQMLSHGQKGLGPRLDMTIHVLFKLSVSELITETIVSLSSLSPEIVCSRLNDYRPSNRKWDLSRLPHFEKNFYHEQRAVSSRSDVC